MYRDCTLNQISESDIGKKMQVAGWVENIRDHGGVSFIDLRDMYGVLQVVMRDTSLLKGISREDCVSISGLKNGMRKPTTPKFQREPLSWRLTVWKSSGRLTASFPLK